MATATLELRADSRQVRTATRDLRGLERQGSSTERVASSLRTAFVALGGALAVQRVIRYADAYTSVQNRLRVVTDSTSELVRVQERLLQISNETRTELDASATLYARTARAVEDLGVSQEQLFRVVDVVNKSFAVSGATAQEAENAIRQLSQGLASGTLRGEEFNSVSEQAPEILRAISKETGMARGALREWAAEGNITTELLITSLLNYGEELDEIFEKSERTFGQSLTVANNNLTTFIGQANSSTGALGLLGDAVVDLSEGLDDFNSEAATTLEAVARGAAFVGNAFRGIEFAVRSVELYFLVAERTAMEVGKQINEEFAELAQGVTDFINDAIRAYNRIPGLDDVELLPDTASERIAQYESSINDLTLEINDTKFELRSLAAEPLPTEKVDAYFENWKQNAKEAAEETENLNSTTAGQPQANRAAPEIDFVDGQYQFGDKLTEQLDQEREYYDNSKSLAKEAADFIIEQERRKEEAQRQQMERQNSMLSSFGDVFGNFAEIAREGGEESFEAYKLLASAQAGMSAAVAINRALAEGGPFLGPALATSIAALTGVQIARINQQEYNPRRQGGQVLGGQSYLVGEDGPEMVTMGGAGRVTPFNQLMQSKGGETNLSVELINKGEPMQARVTGERTEFTAGQERRIVQISLDAAVNDINRRQRIPSALSGVGNYQNRAK